MTKSYSLGHERACRVVSMISIMGFKTYFKMSIHSWLTWLRKSRQIHFLVLKREIYVPLNVCLLSNKPIKSNPKSTKKNSQFIPKIHFAIYFFKKCERNRRCGIQHLWWTRWYLASSEYFALILLFSSDGNLDYNYS